MPCGPSSVARLWASASSAALAILYGADACAGRWRSTIELIITTDPRLAASAGVNSRVSRSAATTLVSNAGLHRVQIDVGEVGDRRHDERVVHQRVDPAERAPARPRPAAAAAVAVGDVGRHRQRPAPKGGDLLGHLLQPGRGAGGEHDVGAPAARAGQRDLAGRGPGRRRRPRPPCPGGTSAQLPITSPASGRGDGGLPGGDPRPRTPPGVTRACSWCGSLRRQARRTGPPRPAARRRA